MCCKHQIGLEILKNECDFIEQIVYQSNQCNFINHTEKYCVILTIRIQNPVFVRIVNSIWKNLKK